MHREFLSGAFDQNLQHSPRRRRLLSQPAHLGCVGSGLQRIAITGLTSATPPHNILWWRSVWSSRFHVCGTPPAPVPPFSVMKVCLVSLAMPRSWPTTRAAVALDDTSDEMRSMKGKQTSVGVSLRAI